jgi:UDP-GlcNAc:undecaprenyl-phosphate/decaprenyl-phosphate GlcNAc-1-phosphate transferase
MMSPAISPQALMSSGAKLSVDDVLKPYVWVFYGAFIVAFLMTPIMRRVAIYYDVVDKPDGLRKVHREPVAYLGGVAVFLGWLVGMAISQFCQWHLGSYWWADLGANIYIPLQIVIAAVVVVALGLLDDIWTIGAYWKIVGQVFAAVVLLSADIGTHITQPFIENIAIRLPRVGLTLSPDVFDLIVTLTSWGLTTAIVVFCCNASNLMDGLDGLCGGVTAIIALGLVVLAVNLAMFVSIGNVQSVHFDALRVIIALALLGATLGFVPYNFNPASIFMGDAGSLFLGFTCALMIILLGEAEGRWLLAAMVMFALPVLDTALAFARRKLAGRPLFSADKQHLHHQLVARGMSVRQAVLTAYALAIFFVICGIAIVYIRTRYAVAFYLVLFGSIIVAAYKMGMIHERAVPAPRPEMGGTGIQDVPQTEDTTPVA